VSGADLKQRLERIMQNQSVLLLGTLKKGLLVGAALTSLALPLILGLVVIPSAIAQVDSGVGVPHPGTEAAVREQIEGWENHQPDTSDMAQALIDVTRQQQPS